MAEGGSFVCGYKNQHGVQCGLKKGHIGSHETDEQLIEPDPFCIQAHDRFALATIRAWIVCAKSHGVPATKIQKAEETYKAIDRWQRIHGTKLPD